MQREALRAASASDTISLSASMERSPLRSSVLGGGLTAFGPRPGGRKGGGAAESRDLRVTADMLLGAARS